MKKFTTLLSMASLISILAACSLFQKHRNNDKSQTMTASTQSTPPVDKVEDGLLLKSIPVKSDMATSAQAPAKDAGNEIVQQPLWTYQGTKGPMFWSEINPDFTLCGKGERQSPIDLKYRAPKSKKEVILDYKPSLWRITWTGLTLRIEFSKNNFLYLNGETYELKEAVFHTPAEHTLSGKEADAEVQLFHMSADGKMAAVATFLKADSTKSNDLLKKIFEHRSVTLNQTVEVSDDMFDPSLFLPEARSHYEYDGSLSYPPCTEGVKWIVYNTPVKSSSAQVGDLKKLLGENNRPTQPNNNREVKNFP